MSVTRNFTLVLVVFFSACGPAKVDLTPPPSDRALENMPPWMMTPPNEPGYLFASATATSQDIQMATDKAKIAAQANLAQQMQIRLESLTKRFQEETGLAGDSQLLSQFTTATKTIVQQNLVGARVKEQKMVQDKGVFRSYVLMTMALGEANEVLVNQVKTNQELYTRFRSTKAFDELEKETQELGKK